MSKVHAACRRARQQLRYAYLAGDGDQVAVLLGKVLGAQKSKKGAKYGRVWAADQQFARYVGPAANDDYYESH